MFTRGCLNCGAYFKNNKTLERLKTHKEKCTKEKPYYNDEKADGYEEI